MFQYHYVINFTIDVYNPFEVCLNIHLPVFVYIYDFQDPLKNHPLEVGTNANVIIKLHATTGFFN